MEEAESASGNGQGLSMCPWGTEEFQTKKEFPPV